MGASGWWCSRYLCLSSCLTRPSSTCPGTTCMKKRTSSECQRRSGVCGVHLSLMVPKHSPPLPTLPPRSPACSLGPVKATANPLTRPGALSLLPSAWGLCTACLWHSPCEFLPGAVAQEPAGACPESRAGRRWRDAKPSALRPTSILEPAPHAQKLGIYVLMEGVWRLLSPALTSHSVPGLEPGQLGVGEGTSGSSCAPRGGQAGPPTLLSFHKVGS